MCGLTSHPALQCYLLRKLLEHDLEAADLRDEDVYFCSLSCRTIVYKGQLTPEQVRENGRGIHPRR